MIFIVIYVLLIIFFLSSFYIGVCTSLVSNEKLEFIWSVSPVFILLPIIIPSLTLLYFSAIRPVEYKNKFSCTVHITGSQWFWTYNLTDFTISDENFKIVQEFLVHQLSLRKGF